MSSSPVHSAPTLMDLINADNVELHDVDVATLEEQWFNNPDPYDLTETERVDEALHPPSFGLLDTSTLPSMSSSMIPSSSLSLRMLMKLGLGQPPRLRWPQKKAAVAGKPGKWSIDSFLQNNRMI